MKKFTLHDLPKDDRPRERLQKVGIDNLSLQELLALEEWEQGKSEEEITKEIETEISL